MAETCPRLVKAWFLLVIANNVQYFKYIFQCTVLRIFKSKKKKKKRVNFPMYSILSFEIHVIMNIGIKQCSVIIT